MATFVLAVVGFAVVAQTTPLSVTVAPPSAVTFPARVAFTAPTVVAAVVVTVGTTVAAVSNNLKLSIPHSSLFPSEYTRIRKLNVVPVLGIVLTNSPKTLVSCVPSPQPLLSVSSNKYFNPVPLELPLL